MNTKKIIIYEEKLSSPKTAALFVVLALIFLALTLWHSSTNGSDALTITFAILFIFFLFYSLNYRILIIRIFAEALKLQFGIFSWTVPFENIAAYELDNNLPLLMKYGGAGIHFMMIHGRYRVSFNFLEHDRVVIHLQKKQGWVRDVSFSTKQPEKILEVFQQH